MDFMNGNFSIWAMSVIPIINFVINIILYITVIVTLFYVIKVLKKYLEDK